MRRRAQSRPRFLAAAGVAAVTLTLGLIATAAADETGIPAAHPAAPDAPSDPLSPRPPSSGAAEFEDDGAEEEEGAPCNDPTAPDGAPVAAQDTAEAREDAQPAEPPECAPDTAPEPAAGPERDPVERKQMAGTRVRRATDVSAERVVLDDGHVDYAARIINGKLQSLVKDGTRGSGPGQVKWRQPSSVVFELGTAAEFELPSGSTSLSFLGDPGERIWMISQVQESGVLWAGWNTEEIRSAQIRGKITWSLRSASGPGTVAIFQTGSFGATDILFSSHNGLPDSRKIPLGTHAHGNWAFTEGGTYRLRFRMSGKSRSGGRTLTDTETLTVSVGGGGPSGGDGGNGGDDAEGPSQGHDPAGAEDPAGESGQPAANGDGPGAAKGSHPNTGQDFAPLAGVALALLIGGGALRAGVGWARRPASGSAVHRSAG